MILVDANLLVYASAPAMPQYGVVRAWFDDQLNGTTRVGLPWPSLLGFLRVITNPRAFQTPQTYRSAWGHVERSG